MTKVEKALGVIIINGGGLSGKEKAILRAFGYIASEGLPLDLASLRDAMKRYYGTSWTEDFGGIDYLVDLCENAF